MVFAVCTMVGCSTPVARWWCEATGFPGGEQRLAVGQPAYPCAEIGGMIFTYLGSDESPALPAGETFVAPTKVLRAENYLRGILGADEKTNGARFVAPNIVVSKAFSDTGSCVRWHVPVDNDSHVEFVVQSLSDLPLIGEPLAAAYQVLLKSIEGRFGQASNRPRLTMTSSMSSREFQRGEPPR